jgi:hypothetical protein
MDTLIETYTLSSTLYGEGIETQTEETFSTKEEALHRAWGYYYFDGGCSIGNFKLNGEPLILKEGN